MSLMFNLGILMFLHLKWCRFAFEKKVYPWFRRKKVVFFCIIKHWTSCLSSRGYLRVHRSLLNQSTCVLWTWRRHLSMFLGVSCGGNLHVWGMRLLFLVTLFLYNHSEGLGSNVCTDSALDSCLLVLRLPFVKDSSHNLFFWENLGLKRVEYKSEAVTF